MLCFKYFLADKSNILIKKCEYAVENRINELINM